MVRFFYGARTEQDLFYLDLISEVGGGLADFDFVPVLSEGGEGFVHEAACRQLESGAMTDPEIYLCGPPPMIDAMIEQATEQHGIEERQIFHDKFTTSADAAAV